MNSAWKTKIDPAHHPVRFAAKLWQAKMQERFGISEIHFASKQFGQLKTLLRHLNDLTPFVIDWSLDPVNWWHFCQQVRIAHKIHFMPDYPEVGFLLQYRGVALNLMHSKLKNSPEGAEFIQKLEKKKFEQIKNLLLVYATGDSATSAKIASIKTLVEMELLFNEMMEGEAKSA